LVGRVIADLGDQAHGLIQNPGARLLRLGGILGEAGGVHRGDLVRWMLHRNRLASFWQTQAGKGLAGAPGF
jgi:hypothetical protein